MGFGSHCTNNLRFRSDLCVIVGFGSDRISNILWWDDIDVEIFRCCLYYDFYRKGWLKSDFWSEDGSEKILGFRKDIVILICGSDWLMQPDPTQASTYRFTFYSFEPDFRICCRLFCSQEYNKEKFIQFANFQLIFLTTEKNQNFQKIALIFHICRFQLEWRHISWIRWCQCT